MAVISITDKVVFIVYGHTDSDFVSLFRFAVRNRKKKQHNARIQPARERHSGNDKKFASRTPLHVIVMRRALTLTPICTSAFQSAAEKINHRRDEITLELPMLVAGENNNLELLLELRQAVA